MGIIMFGSSAQRAEIKRLKADIRSLRCDLNRLQDTDANHGIELDSIRTSHRLEVDQIRRENAADRVDLVADHESTVQGLKNNNTQEVEMVRSQLQIKLTKAENALNELEKSVDDRVDEKLAAGKKDLRIRGDRQDKEHADRMKRLEADFAAKTAKCDRDLEADKASYRKYLRGENNSRIETLEKENKRLLGENTTLTADAKAGKYTLGVLEGQIKSMAGVVETLSESHGNLSEKIAEGLVKAMPTIEASFETPKTPETHVHVEPAQAQKGGNQGGGEKKKEGGN